LADEGEGDEIEELLSDDLLSKLNVLHEREELMEPSLTLKDIPKLYDELPQRIRIRPYVVVSRTTKFLNSWTRVAIL
jgi:hypothetical protein